MDRIKGPRQTLRAQRGLRETSEFSTQSDHEKLRRKTKRLNHADGQQREQLESPRVPSQGTVDKADLVILYLSSVVQVHSNARQDIHEIWQALQKAI